MLDRANTHAHNVRLIADAPQSTPRRSLDKSKTTAEEQAAFAAGHAAAENVPYLIQHWTDSRWVTVQTIPIPEPAL